MTSKSASLGTSSAGEAGSIAPPASDEFTEGIRWYEQKRAGLGGEFYDAVVRAVDLIREQPAIGLTLENPRSIASSW